MTYFKKKKSFLFDSLIYEDDFRKRQIKQEQLHLMKNVFLVFLNIAIADVFTFLAAF
jgi:hypothetical protein